MIIETPRLVLREMCDDDFEKLYEIFSDAETMKYYPHTFDEAKAKEAEGRAVLHHHDDHYFGDPLAHRHGDAVAQKGAHAGGHEAADLASDAVYERVPDRVRADHPRGQPEIHRVPGQGQRLAEQGRRGRGGGG